MSAVKPVSRGIVLLACIASVAAASKKNACAIKTKIDIQEEEDEEEVIGASFALVFMALLAVCFMLGAIIKKREITWLPEAGATMMVGMLAGGLMLASSPKDEITETLMGFSPEIFMVCMLPPIIFDSGYKMKSRFFFGNIHRIMAFAFVGTFLSTWVVGLATFALSKVTINLSLAECLTFGSLISATDPVSTLAIFKELSVDLNLYYTVLGESVFNDAVAIVLFRTFGKFVDCESISPGAAFLDFLLIFVASTLIGVAFGLLSALLFKYSGLRSEPGFGGAPETAMEQQSGGSMNGGGNPAFSRMRSTSISLASRVNSLGREEHFNVPELGVCLLFSYVPFLFAEAVQMSGIVAILFTGITMRHYTRSNLSLSSQQYTDDLYHLVAHIAETAVFLNLGLSVFSHKTGYHSGFIIWVGLICLLSRAMHIYPLSLLLNKCVSRQSHNRLPMNEQHMIWFSGLRGAIAFACASEFPGNHKDEIQSTTMVIVLFTVFFLGGTTVPMLRRLDIRQCYDSRLDELEAEQDELDLPHDQTHHHVTRPDMKPSGHSEGIELPERQHAHRSPHSSTHSAHSTPGSDGRQTPTVSKRTSSLMSFDAKYIKPIFSTAYVVDSSAASGSHSQHHTPPSAMSSRGGGNDGSASRHRASPAHQISSIMSGEEEAGSGSGSGSGVSLEEANSNATAVAIAASLASPNHAKASI